MSEIVLLFVDFLEIIFGNLIEGIPLLDDFADNFTFSEFRELSLVLVVLLPGELSVNLALKFFDLFAHMKNNEL